MTEIRRQLTLFIPKQNEIIESIRAAYNPEQYKLIAAHVTLCREDEIELLHQVLENIKSIRLAQPVCLTFGKIQRFPNGKGVFIPAEGENREFQQLRKAILKGIIEQPRYCEPHITLMHPRNSTCTSALFTQLTQYTLPAQLYVDKISLIEQKKDGIWKVIEEYVITENMG